MNINFSRKKIRQHRGLAERLTRARKRKCVNLEIAERETKVAMKHLYALEHAEYENLPADIYVIGYLKRYAEYLEISPDDVVRMFKEEKKIHESMKLIKKHPDQKSKDDIKVKTSEKITSVPKFYLSPELTTGIIITAIVSLLLGYIWFQVKSFAAAPPLEVQNSDAEIVVDQETIVIEGKTDNGADVTINGEAVSVMPDGEFKQEIRLETGINKVEIIAKNKAQKETTKTIQILSK